MVNGARSPIERYAPFKLITTLLYAPDGNGIHTLGPLLIELDHVPVARRFKTSGHRLREWMDWLQMHGYLRVESRVRGRSILRLRPPHDRMLK